MNSKSEIHLFDEKSFTATVDGNPVSIYTLSSGNGLVMQVTNYGARVVSLWAPDRDGKCEDVVLGYENIDRYLNGEGERFLGAVVGRYANRIAFGQFKIDGVEYTLPRNNGDNCLHGGEKGLDRVAWTVDSVTDNELAMSYISPDGEEGFPGKLNIVMVYTLTPENEFQITYKITTDRSTHVNMSHHSFFNLKGEGNGTAMDNVLTINANKIVPINASSIPTGSLRDVGGTPFDFRTPYQIGERIGEDDDQLRNGSGYDHSWVLSRKTPKGIEWAATLYEPTSGRVMEVWTDQPGMQFYSSNFFDGVTNGKYGKPLKRRESVALEVQKFPDSPNQPEFPSTRLNPGEVYTQTCIYKFKTK